MRRQHQHQHLHKQPQQHDHNDDGDGDSGIVDDCETLLLLPASFIPSPAAPKEAGAWTMSSGTPWHLGEPCPAPPILNIVAV